MIDLAIAIKNHLCHNGINTIGKKTNRQGDNHLDIKQIRYFIAIVENHFNLSQAAELLYVSQPTLSMMINDFEKGKMLSSSNEKEVVLLG